MVHLVGCLYKHVYLGTSLTCFPHQTDVAQVQLVFAQIRGYINYSLDLIAVPPHLHPFSHAHCKQVRGASCCLITRSARPTQPWSGLVWSNSTATATASAVRHFWWPLGPDNFDQNQLETRFHHYSGVQQKGATSSGF